MPRVPVGPNSGRNNWKMKFLKPVQSWDLGHLWSADSENRTYSLKSGCLEGQTREERGKEMYKRGKKERTLDFGDVI